MYPVVSMMLLCSRHWRAFTLALAGALACALPALAQDKAAPFETSAKQAVLFDFNARSFLFEQQGEQKIAPASLAKIMTAAIVFRELREGRLKMDGDMVVSTDAWRRGGAVSGSPNMLLTPNKVLKVSELLTGLVVGAANDAAITLAENIAGTEARFVAMMNSHAQELGLKSTTFKNATGFMAEGQEASLRDLVILSAHLIATYPDYYALFAQKEMPFGRNKQVNRNPLIAMDIGADGLMTGSVPEVGHALVGSSVQEGRRVIVAVAGVETVQERSIEARKLLEWGHRRFEIRTLFDADAIVGEVSVYGGASASVEAKLPRELRLPTLRGQGGATSLKMVYRGPVPAPITEGQEVARLEVLLDGRVIQSAPLVAVKAVATGSTLARAQDAAVELSRQWAKNGFRWLLDKMSSARKPKENAPKDASAGAT